MVGPVREASNCPRGQTCALSLAVPGGPDWQGGWPTSRVIFGTGLQLPSTGRCTDHLMGDSLPFIELGKNRSVLQLASRSRLCAILDHWDLKCWEYVHTRSLGNYFEELPFIDLGLDLIIHDVRCILSSRCVVLATAARGTFDARNQIFITKESGCGADEPLE